MRTLLLVCGLLGGGHALAEPCRVAGAALAFADGGAAKAILTTEDGFVRALSPFDRAARLKTDQDVATAAYLRFVGDQARSWTTDERRNLDVQWCALARAVAAKGWKLTLPKTVSLVKTSGQEEGQTPYTRGDAIIVPERVAPSVPVVLLAHELFHILSRQLAKAVPARLNELYQIVGYQPLDGELAVPAELRPLAITNPDSYAIHHAVKVKAGDTTVLAVPFLFASRPRYDVQKGGEFFQYLQFKLLPVHRAGKTWQVDRDSNQRLVVLDPSATNYTELVGRNTDENFQADELLANNFALALESPAQPVPDAWVVQKLDAALKH
jgi:hypothetical protein